MKLFLFAISFIFLFVFAAPVPVAAVFDGIPAGQPCSLLTLTNPCSSGLVCDNSLTSSPGITQSISEGICVSPSNQTCSENSQCQFDYICDGGKCVSTTNQTATGQPTTNQTATGQPTAAQTCSATQPCTNGETCGSDGTCSLVILITHGTQQCANGENGLCNPLKVKSIQGLLTAVLSFIVKIGSIIIVLMLVLTGFKFVLAQGNSDKLAKAREMLMWTLIGALIILGAQAISAGIQSTINAISS